MSRLLSLYPEVWRERYGDEFLVLLADRPPSIGDRLDIVRGALDAQLRPQLGPIERDVRVAAPLLGLVAWAVVLLLVVASPEVVDEYGTYRESGAIVFLPWIATMLLLACGYAGAAARLPASQRFGRGAAIVAAVAASLLMLGPWLIHVWAVLLGSTLILALAGLRAGWRRAPTAMLAGTSGVASAAIAVLLTQPWWVGRTLEPVVGVSVVLAVIATWPLLGCALVGVPIRRRPGEAGGRSSSGSSVAPTPAAEPAR